MASLEASAAAGSQEGNSQGGPVMALPWNRIPALVPASTNVEQYSRTVRFLYRLWPAAQNESFVISLLLKIEGMHNQQREAVCPKG